MCSRGNSNHRRSNHRKWYLSHEHLLNMFKFDKWVSSNIFFFTCSAVACGGATGATGIKSVEHGAAPADPPHLSAAATLDTCRWDNTALPNLVIYQYLRCWNSCTARTPVTDFFFSETWKHTLKAEPTILAGPQFFIQLYLFLTMRVSG